APAPVPARVDLYTFATPGGCIVTVTSTTLSLIAKPGGDRREFSRTYRGRVSQVEDDRSRDNLKFRPSTFRETDHLRTDDADLSDLRPGDDLAHHTAHRLFETW